VEAAADNEKPEKENPSKAIKKKAHKKIK